MAKLAIISTNRSKYSETFIHMHIKDLPFEIVVYSDGYFPTSISVDKGSNFEELKEQRKWWKKPDPKMALIQSFQEHEIDVVLAEYGPSGTEVMEICKELQIPLVVHFHGYDAYRNDVLETYGKRYKQLFDSAHAVIGVSKDMCKQLEKLGCDPQKLEYVPYGIDTTLFKPSEGAPKKNAFVACGRLVEKKGPLLTLLAFWQLSKEDDTAELIMIGDGERENACKGFVSVHYLKSRVTFTGALNQKDIAEIYRTAFAFVQHSHTTDENDSEGTPLAILEASAAGLPIIATRHGGIVDVVDDGITGYLVDEHDVMGMAAKMKLLLSDSNQAAEMGQRGREKMLTHYRTVNYLSRLTQILEDSNQKQ